MAQAVTLNGSSFSIPDVGENDWGQNVTDFLVAIPGAVLQKSGGSFTLTAEVDFGATYGLKSAYYKSRAANPASAGAIRLGVADVVSFRNNANGANLDIGLDAADALTFGSNKVVTVAGGFTLVGTLTFANQKGIRLSEQTGNGTNYLELVAPDAVTANVTLKLPDGAGSAGQVLSTDGSGNLSWIAAAGGGTINSGVQGRLAVYSAAGTTLDDVVTMTNTVSVAIAAHGQATVITFPDGGQATANVVLSEGAATINGAKTLSGVTTLSGSSTGIFLISNANTLKVDSTNGLVSIGTTTMSFPLYVAKSIVGNEVTICVENTDGTNGSSAARLSIRTGGASGGDPYVHFYNGVVEWVAGVDNSVSDNFVISAGTAPGISNTVSITTAGAVTIPLGNFDVTRSASGANVSIAISNTSNTASSNALLSATVAGSSAGDALASFIVTGGSTWSIGVDNSNSDWFFISASATLGSSDVMRFKSTDITSLVDHYVQRSNSGGTVGLYIENSSNTASSHSQLQVNVAGTSAGDALISFTVSGGTTWSIGADNSDGDKFKLSKSSALGTNDYITTDGNGALVFPFLGGISVECSSSGNVSVIYLSHSSNTASSDSAMLISVAGTSAGDPYIRFTITSGSPANWAMGVDNSDSDTFKIQPSSTLSGGSGLVMSGAGNIIMQDGSAGSPAYSFYNAQATGVFRTGSTSLGFAIPSGANFSFYENSVEVMRYDGGGDLWSPDGVSTKTIDFGTSSKAFDDMYADDFNNVADIPFFDHVLHEGKEVTVNDLDIIRNIKPLRDKEGKLVYNENGHAYWDDSTLPNWLWMRNRRDRSKINYDPDGKPWVSLKVLSGLALGAVGQLTKEFDGVSVRVQTIENQITDLTQRVKTLEQAA